MKHVLVTGGFGYKGSILVPKLLRKGYEVTVLDTGWFGQHIERHANMKIILGDLRDLAWIPKVDAIIHLAGIANDPCGELDAKLTWEVNVLAHDSLCRLAVEQGVQQFIYASSASVYGIQGNKPVTEENPMAPVSDYNKTKQIAERVLLSYSDRMPAIQIVRPATICGYSPRMRFDVVVNMLTLAALKEHEIVVKTPDLFRPHCHIQDVTDLYIWLLDHSEITGTFNAGFDNQTIMETALKIAQHVGCEVRRAPHVAGKYDKRSYLVDSSKIIAAGFKPQRNVETAIEEIVDMYRSGALRDDERCINLSWMRKNGWVSETR